MSGKKEDDYTTIRIPKELSGEMEKLIGKKGFRSKAEIVKEALRRLLEHYKEVEVLPRLEKINSNYEGVKILDREQHRVADIFFKPDGIWCDLCKSETCEHIDFAFAQSDIQTIIRKRRKEGWKLPEI
jgi:Arc/MetJ-type ribon-helix-helix transcriptional regulator